MGMNSSVKISQIIFVRSTERSSGIGRIHVLPHTLNRLSCPSDNPSGQGIELN